MILIGSETAEGITSVRDPRIAAFFEQSVAKEFPFLQREGQAKAVETGLGPGVLFHFTGPNKAGVAMVADVYVTLFETSGLYLAHVAPKPIAEKRRSVIQAVFASLAKSRRQLDLKLLGAWQNSDYRRTDSSSRAARAAVLSRTAYSYFVFLENGGFVFVQTSSMAGGTADLDILISGNSADARRGTWWTDGNKVHLAYDQGEVQEYLYKVEGGVPVVLEMNPHSGPPTLYQKLRR
jgi:hypothetical protein